MTDKTLISKDEFFKNIDEALAQYERGEVISFTNKEEMNRWLQSL